MLLPVFFDIPKVSKNLRKKLSCSQCKLFKNAKHPKIEPYGNFKKEIMLIGESPGLQGDENRKPWQNEERDNLQKAFKEFDINLFEDCISLNAVNCCPIDENGKSRSPNLMEINCCHEKVVNAIQEYQPSKIFLFDQCALQSVIGSRWKKDLGTISRWRGMTIPDREYNAWICPQFAPIFPERGEKEIRSIWMQDLQKAFELPKKIPIFKDAKKQITFLNEKELYLLETLSDPIAFDYETTGLKPHNTKLHRIVIMSAADMDKCYVFIMPKKGTKGFAIVRNFLQSKRGKIASNMKFEDNWTNVSSGYEVKNWIWDTMLCAHVIDNRRWISGLKFQVYITFGIIDYDSEISSYLESIDKKNANSVNKIDELMKTSEGKRKLMTYCGLDSIFERWLAQRQMKKLNYI